MLRQLVISLAVGWASRCVHRGLSILRRLDEQIKRRGEKDGERNHVPVDLKFPAEELEKKMHGFSLCIYASILGASPGEIHHWSIIFAIMWEVVMRISYRSSRSWSGMRAVCILLWTYV